MRRAKFSVPYQHRAKKRERIARILRQTQFRPISVTSVMKMYLYVYCKERLRVFTN